MKNTESHPMRLEDHLNKARHHLAGLNPPSDLTLAIEEIITAILIAAGGEPSILNARRVIARALSEDKGFRETYLANIACVLMDFENARLRLNPERAPGPLTTVDREVLAERILIVLFLS